MHGLTLILVIIIILALVGGGLGWPGTTVNQRQYYGVGPYWGGGGLGLILVVLIILALLGRI